MISNTFFRSTCNILQQAEGSYVDGRWTAGADTLTVFTASVQPVTGRELETLNIGQRELGKVKIYTNTELRVANNRDNVGGDIVIFQGMKYEVISVEAWQSEIVSHYKYYAEYRGEYT